MPEPTPIAVRNRLAAGLMVGGLLLRLPGLFTDFWLDEIWSHKLVHGSHLESWLTIFQLHHSNNHYLNSLVLYLLGPDVPYEWYRLPALLASALALALLYQHYRLRRDLEALCALGVFALLFPHICYATEARGYAFATLGTLGAWFVIEHGPQDSRRQLPLYGLLLSFALVGHLTVLMVFPALTLYIYERRRDPEPGLVQVRPALLALAYHLPPMLTYALLHVIDLRHTPLGTSASFRAQMVESDLFLSWLFLDRIPIMLNDMLGLGWQSWLGLLAGLGISAAVWAWAWTAWRQGNRQQAALALALWLTPLVLLLAKREVRLFPRQLLMAYTLLALVFGALIARGLRSDVRWRRYLMLAAIAIVLATNGYRLVRFFQDGRGGYEAAVTRMVQVETTDRPVRVNGDYDFRQQMIVQFYASRLPGDQQLVYVTRDQLDEVAPDWFILRQPLGDEFRFSGFRYVRDSKYPASGYSGQTWYLFGRQP